MIVALSAATSCQKPPADLDPREADFVALCDVREENDGLVHIIKEVWKGQELLPSELRSHPEGKTLMVEAKDPNAVVSATALVCLKSVPGSTDILANTQKRTTFYVEQGQIEIFRDGVHHEPISIQTLRCQIKK